MKPLVGEGKGFILAVRGMGAAGSDQRGVSTASQGVLTLCL